MSQHTGTCEPEEEATAMEDIQTYNPLGKAVIDAASRHTGFTVDQIKGYPRSAVPARFAVCLALHRKGWSYPRIGRLLNDRDHTTIMNAVKRAKDDMAMQELADRIAPLALSVDVS